MILSLSWCSRKIDAVISGQSRLFFDRSATTTNPLTGRTSAKAQLTGDVSYGSFVTEASSPSRNQFPLCLQ